MPLIHINDKQNSVVLAKKIPYHLVNHHIMPYLEDKKEIEIRTKEDIDFLYEYLNDKYSMDAYNYWPIRDDLKFVIKVRHALYMIADNVFSYYADWLGEGVRDPYNPGKIYASIDNIQMHPHGAETLIRYEKIKKYYREIVETYLLCCNPYQRVIKLE